MLPCKADTCNENFMAWSQLGTYNSRPQSPRSCFLSMFR